MKLYYYYIQNVQRQTGYLVPERMKDVFDFRTVIHVSFAFIDSNGIIEMSRGCDVYNMLHKACGDVDTIRRISLDVTTLAENKNAEDRCTVFGARDSRGIYVLGERYTWSKRIANNSRPLYDIVCDDGTKLLSSIHGSVASYINGRIYQDRARIKMFYVTLATLGHNEF